MGLLPQVEAVPLDEPREVTDAVDDDHDLPSPTRNLRR